MEKSLSDAMALFGGATMTAASFGRATAASRLGSASKTLYRVTTVTSCDKIRQLDASVMHTVTEWQKRGSPDTMVMLGRTSEFASFPMPERKLVTEIVLKNKKGLNFIIGPAMPNIAQTINLRSQAADDLLVIPLFHFNFSQADLMQTPISFYHVLLTSEVPIDIQLLKNLQHDRHLADTDDSSGDRAGYTEFVRLFQELNICLGTINHIEIAIENGTGKFSAGVMPPSRSAPRSPLDVVKRTSRKAEIDKLRDTKAINDVASGMSYCATQEYILSLEMRRPQIFPRRLTSNSPMGRNPRWRWLSSRSTRRRSVACSIRSWNKLTRSKEGDPMTRIGPRYAVGIFFAALMLTSSLAAAQIMLPSGQVVTLHREAYAEDVTYLKKFNGALGERNETLAAIHADSAPPFKALTVAAQRDTGSTGTTLSGTNSNSDSIPYQAIARFLKMPPGRNMGSTSGVAVDSKGHIWVAERCGANSCQDSSLDPIMEFDEDGRFVKAFGGGMFVFPHGLYIDRKDNIWLTDARAAGGKGAQVFQFDSRGKVLLRLGSAGVSAEGPDTFLEPNAVIVSLDRFIFVADGHTPNKPARLVKFDANGRFLKQWGSTGGCPGQFDVPHALAMDSKGRLFVGDRGNNRIQIYDEEGILLDSWTQFGRPSGLYIDDQDTLYVADSESRMPGGYGHHPGWRRGIRIGSAVDGRVTTFIPDPTPDPDKHEGSGTEGIWADSDGVIYGAEVLQKTVSRYVKR
ncbi:hypothetical protein NLM16_16490 [Bradyrhizobium brasilense]|uniref:hypothetical protein n=1 Tax=Bradyrhizobium brasilense TaxID=1419277 RepID=UPI0028772973|nr:hypothetical protein [Bradyrhizobium brasilense]MCP3415707.1 hypothetical protein [Bradyrhizobium brasilense]